MKKILIALAIAAVVAAMAFFWLTQPRPSALTYDADRAADLQNGALLFHAGGCASCHAAVDAEGEQRLLLSGGVRLESPFGVFVAPNISPHPDAGIGAWTAQQFIDAMTAGVSPQGEHYYPAFPYTYYQNMRADDLVDLQAYIGTLPASKHRAGEHELGFPYNIRRGLGLWKRRYLAPAAVSAVDSDNAQLARGRYLVEGPGHCGACHTPRDSWGGPIVVRRLAGVAGSDKSEAAPNISSHSDGIGDWSETDIAYSLASGFTPEFDSFGGSMADVQTNMAQLPEDDRAAIAAYLKSTLPVADTEGEASQ